MSTAISRGSPNATPRLPVERGRPESEAPGRAARIGNRRRRLARRRARAVVGVSGSAPRCQHASTLTTPPRTGSLAAARLARFAVEPGIADAEERLRGPGALANRAARAVDDTVGTR